MGKAIQSPCLKQNNIIMFLQKFIFFCEGISLWMESNDKLPAEFILMEVMQKKTPYLNKYNLYCYHNYSFLIFLSILYSRSYLKNYSDPCSRYNNLKVFHNYPHDMTCIYWLFCNKTPSSCIK